MNKSYRINIKNPVACIMNSDNAEGTEYGEIFSLGEAQTIVVTPSVASGTLYGDGAQQEAESRLTGIAVALDSTKIPMDARIKLYEYETKDGVVLEEAGQKANYIAFGYETEQTDKESEFTWLLKGKPRPMNENRQQSDSNINYSTDKLEIDFVRRKSDNMLRYFAEVGTAGFTQEQAAKWFQSGPTAPVSKDTVENTDSEDIEDNDDAGNEGTETES